MTYKRLLLTGLMTGLVSLHLYGCSHIPQQGESDVTPVEASPDAASKDMDGDLLYEILSGEFSGVRGELHAAVTHYLSAAKLTDDPQIAHRAAQVALYAERYKDALQSIRRWESLTEDTPQNHFEIAKLRLVALLHLGRTEQATQAAHEMVYIDDEFDPRAMQVLEQVLSREAKPEVAVDLLNRLNEQNPKQFPILVLLARFQIEAGINEAANATLDQVLEITDSNSGVWMLKARALSALGRQDEALDAMGRAVDISPENDRLRLQYASMLISQKRYEEAWEHFVLLRSDMPDNQDVLLSLSLLSIETDRPDLARQYLQELLDKGERVQQAHYYMGRLLQNLGEGEQALAHYEQVTEGNFVLDAKLRIASLYAQQGEVERALGSLDNLLDDSEITTTERIRIYLTRGEILRRVGRNKDALEIYNKALAAEPENIDLLYARALTAEKLDMLEMAEKDLRDVISQDPDNANALNALGYTLADRSQRLEEAKGYILRAIELLPDDAAILDSLGWVCYRMGDNQEALKWLRKAFAQLEDAEIAAHLGEVLWVSGNHEEANKIWQRGLQLRPDHEMLNATIKRFRE